MIALTAAPSSPLGSPKVAVDDVSVFEADPRIADRSLDIPGWNPRPQALAVTQTETNYG